MHTPAGRARLDSGLDSASGIAWVDRCDAALVRVGDAALVRVGDAVHQRHADPAFPDDPTPATTALVLLSAATAEHTRPSDLVPVVALSPSGITQLLDRIEDAGLVVRDAGLTGDRREIRIGLTPAGERSLAVRLERLTARAGAVATFLDALLVPLLEE